MTHSSHPVDISFDGLATYRIIAKGRVDDSWSDHLAGMHISFRSQGDGPTVTTLTGRVKDQAELFGVLSNLYELHMPILLVETLGTIEDDRAGLPDQDKSYPWASEPEDRMALRSFASRRMRPPHRGESKPAAEGRVKGEIERGKK